MSWSVFLCDRKWNVRKVLHESGHLPIQIGDNLTSFVTDANPLKCVEDLAKSRQNLLHLRSLHDHKNITAFMYTYPKYFVVILSYVDSLSELEHIENERVEAQSWADKHLQIPYHDEYYEIQQINNQLINSERALVKNNQRLKRAMEDVQKANDTISILERDDLTGFYRLPAFEKRAEEILQLHLEKSYQLIVLNLSRFRVIKEFFGEKAGNQLLQKLALFMVGLLPTNQVLFGRGSSITLYMLVSSEHHVCDMLEEKLKTFFEEYPLPNHILAHMGVAERKAGEAVSVQSLCDKALLALDLAQNQRNTAALFYDHKLKEQIADNHLILDGIQEAIVGRQLQLYLQPKVDMVTGQVIGAEGLVRWQHPTKGMISPGVFIPLLEREDLIYEVDQYIWEEACKVLHQRMRLGKRALPISVNIARNDLYRPDLLQVLQNLVTKYQVSASLLHLEILERSYVKDSDMVLQKVQEFRKLGFVIEMDDFGTGESSLSLLADMPVDLLKLDRSFLSKALTDSKRAAVIGCIIQLAQTLDLGILAEGVENQEEAKLLQSLGCRYAQGFFYSRPAPAEAFVALE